ncbi:hypothetical protein BZG36_04787 [Bifiguratus adelaidae]|uniref:Mitochondrial fission 1 protein n=1 Tax=Bifiguratus adelaidae TaxID=1938954 RepID=A0A261XU03_9FUNG|nr:hypothetical protein BZG36_04787 [Bifiguratus adelaidae]
MGDNLPNVQDAEVPLAPQELEVLRRQYVREGEDVSIQTKFNYAWGLVKSNKSVDNREGAQLLTEIYQSSPERRRECLYYLAIANYKLGVYNDARKYNEQLLQFEPTNRQALGLRTMIEKKVAKEGMIGIAIVGGLAAIGGIVIASLVRMNREK